MDHDHSSLGTEGQGKIWMKNFCAVCAAWVSAAASYDHWLMAIIVAHTHTHTRLTTLFPGLPRWAGTRKVKPIWILLKQETVSGSGISWAICKSAPCSRQITTPAPHHSVFYRPDALPATQPTASKHWKQMQQSIGISWLLGPLQQIRRSSMRLPNNGTDREWTLEFHRPAPHSMRAMSLNSFNMWNNYYIAVYCSTDRNLVVSDVQCFIAVTDLCCSQVWTRKQRSASTNTSS